VKVAGSWRYVYRAVDEYGQVIDVYVSARRDATAARAFFDRALAAAVLAPVEVVTDQATPFVGARTAIAGHALCPEHPPRTLRARCRCSTEAAGLGRV